MPTETLFARQVRAWLVLSQAVLWIEGTALASTENSHGERSGEGSTAFSGLASSPTSNLFTGEMNLSVPILIPPARKMATPELTLRYSSSARGQTGFGQGWSLPLGAVYRSTRGGVPRCGDSEFDVQLPNGAFELVHVDGDLYHARTDQAFVAVTADPANNKWTLVDRGGLTYVFGAESSARASRGSPEVFMGSGSACSFTTAWALSEIRDPNGNQILIHYVRDQNSLYPQEILYGGNSGTAIQHPFRVSFSLTDRTFPQISYSSGVRVVAAKVINQIQVEWKPSVGAPYSSGTPGGPDGAVRVYDLFYDESEETGAALLTAVQGTDLPFQEFEYSGGSFGRRQLIEFDAPSGPYLRHSQTVGLHSYVLRSIMDMTGDGVPDFLAPSDADPEDWTVFPGTPDGLTPSAQRLAWKGHSLMPYFVIDGAGSAGHDNLSDSKTNENYDGNVFTWRETIDMTGDGVPDYVDAAPDGGTLPLWRVFPGRCNGPGPSGDGDCGFDTPQLWSRPAGHTNVHRRYQSMTLETLIDMTGDGLPDFVNATWGTHGWDVYENTGSGFSGPLSGFSTAIIPQADPHGNYGGLPFPIPIDDPLEGYNGSTRALIDFNGDALPDIVTIGGYLSLDSSGNITGWYKLWSPDPFPPAGERVALALDVYLNTGDGFESTPIRSPIPTVRGRADATAGWSWKTYRDVPFGRIDLDVLTDLVDVNADGLPDFVHEAPSDGAWHVLLNQGGGRLETLIPPSGAGFIHESPRTWAGMTGPVRKEIVDPSAELTKSTMELFDWNADGIIDRVETPAPTGSDWKIDIMGPVGAGPILPPNLLIRSTNGLRGETEIRYAPSRQLPNAHGETDWVPDLPIGLWVVTGVRSSDGICSAPAGDGIDRFNRSLNGCIDQGHEVVISYEYERGLLHVTHDASGYTIPSDREFRGFKVARRIDIDGNVTEVTFSQDEFTRGMVTKRDIILGTPSEPGSRLLAREESLYATIPGANRTQVYLAASRAESFALVANGTGGLLTHA